MDEWLKSPKLSTDPNDIRDIDQKKLLDALKHWGKEHLGYNLTNDIIADLCLMDRGRKAVEAWRAPPGAISYRPMPIQTKMLLVYRLLELAQEKHQPNTKQQRLTDEEKQFILRHVDNLSVSEIARRMGRAYRTINNFLRSEGHYERPSHRIWSEQEDAFIRDNYAQLGSFETARAIDRSTYAVRVRARNLGVKGRIGRRGRTNA